MVKPLLRIRNLGKILPTRYLPEWYYLDVNAAFDSVWHRGLVFKIIRLNFFFFLYLVFLSYRTFLVYIGSQGSSSVSNPAGRPQYSCLSPIHYNLYTYDLPQLDHCTMIIYADDTSILCSQMFANNDWTNLQGAITKLTQYFTK